MSSIALAVCIIFVTGCGGMRKFIAKAAGGASKLTVRKLTAPSAGEKARLPRQNGVAFKMNCVACGSLKVVLLGTESSVCRDCGFKEHCLDYE